MQNKIIDEGLNIIDASSDMLSLLKPEFTAIPIMVYAIRKAIGLSSDESIKKRIKKIENKLKDKKISIEEFKEKMNNLSEHEQYVVKNNLNNIILTCIPETVDIYISTIIDYIISSQNSKYEELCEIINQLNTTDLKLLQMLKEYQTYGDYQYYKNTLEERNKRIDQQKINNKIIDEYNNNPKNKIKKLKTEFIDRDLRVNKNTIFWKDLKKYYELDISELSFMLLFECENVNGEKTSELAYLTKAFLKLQSLGIIELDFLSTIGTINQLNIERLHITLIGNELIKYIKI